MVPKHEGIDAPAFSCDANSAQQRQGIAAPREAWARHAVLLTGQLEHATVVEPLAVEPAVKIGIFVSRRDVGASVGVGVVHSPAAHVDAQLTSSSFDTQMLERPELD